MNGELNRYKRSILLQDADGRLYTDMRSTFTYESGAEKLYQVVMGDTLQSIAEKVFAGMPEPALLWWVIADFQPEPIIDPTVELTEGDWLVIPSIRDFNEWIMGFNYGESGGAL